jgi:hypothetical protein
MPDEKQKPWFKFYPNDWRGDEMLRLCSLAARGLWIECLALMHKAEPYGHLLVNGDAPSLGQLGKLVATSSGEAGRLLEELKARGVCSVTDAGVVVSRRMVRDKDREAKASESGKRGGNPRLKATDKPTLKGVDNLARTDGRVPEARGQRPDPPNAPPRGPFVGGRGPRRPHPLEERPDVNLDPDSTARADRFRELFSEQHLAVVGSTFVENYDRDWPPSLRLVKSYSDRELSALLGIYLIATGQHFDGKPRTIGRLAEAASMIEAQMRKESQWPAA